MKEVINFLDQKNITEVEINSECDNCCNNTEKNVDENKKSLDKLLKNINSNFDKTDHYKYWNSKEMKKYKCEKFDPNLYNDVIHMNSKKQLLINIPNDKNIKKELIHINVEINNIDDLLKIIQDNPFDETKEYNINMISLYKIQPYLKKLNEMIGMKDLKENILDQILYFIQDLHKGIDNNYSGDFMHTVIYGPPGTGKTEVAKIIGKIFSKMDILKKGTFKKVTRSDLVAGYLGQTATKTNDVINECLGGVLFIDEAYSLGNSEKRDSFSKECIDTLCEGLSNHKDKLMVIIAGYESELKTCFFSYNQGLESRFNWRFKTGEYNGKELYDIFVKKLGKIGWSMDDSITIKWFEKNHVYFKFYGRDIETILSKAKIAHSRRVFCKSSELKKILCIKDLEKGFNNFLKIDEVKNRKEDAESSKRLGMLYI
jgi:SpoVK/Ycf46/Vps4 family AAA+-type ATPase